nr:hypothetical protein [Tanacetum cinerariifolium]
MVANTERMERFDKAIFKQREEITDRMAEIFGLLNELTISRAPKKVLIREEARPPLTKHVDFISLIRMEEEKRVKNKKAINKIIVEPNESDVVKPISIVNIKGVMEDRTDEEMIRSVEEEITERKVKELVEMHRSQPLDKIDYETYNSLPIGPMYNEILKKKDKQKEDMRGNFVIPCNVGGLKYTDALVDQGSDVNVMPLSIYNRLTNEKLVGTDISLSLASHSYIYPLGITKGVLVEVVGYIYPVDFVILDIKEDGKKSFILETTFLTTAKVDIRFDKGRIAIKSGKNNKNFFKQPESLCRVKRGIDNAIKLVALTNTVSRLILE